MMQYTLQYALEAPRQIGIRVTLGQPLIDLDETDLARIKSLLALHGAICLENQPLEPTELHDFVEKWGEVIKLTGGLTNKNQEPGLPSITRVGNIRTDGSIIPGVNFSEYWHHDGDFWAPGENFIINFLNSVVVPPVGGRTGFIDTLRAYALLTDLQKSELEGAWICVRGSEISDFKNAAVHELPADAEHPLLFPHPQTGKIVLYVPDSSTGIQSADGQLISTSQSLIDSLILQAGIYEHEWQQGDLVITDNLQAMHRSMGGYGDNPRLLYRCQARIPMNTPC